MTGEIYSNNWLHIQYLSSVFLQCRAGGVAAGSGGSHAATIACKEKTTAMTNESTTGSPAWDPEATGHALFATRLGPCGVAWGDCGLAAFQLPEVDGPAATRTRMLRGVQSRRPGSYAAAVRAEDLPTSVAQAIAGVQVLMAGHGEWTVEPSAPSAQQLRDGPVLPDLRARRMLPAGQALPDLAELALIEALRSLRIMHYSAWLARRWDDPAFPISFPWFGSERYWGEQILILREQLSALDEEPLRLF